MSLAGLPVGFLQIRSRRLTGGDSPAQPHAQLQSADFSVFGFAHELASGYGFGKNPRRHSEWPALLKWPPGLTAPHNEGTLRRRMNRLVQWSPLNVQ